MKPRLAPVVVMLVLVALATGGCNIVGPLAYFAEGPPKLDAEYILPDVSTVVYVDDRGDAIQSGSQNVRRIIGEEISELLMVKQPHMELPVLTMTIRPADAIMVADREDEADEMMAIDEIGRAVGADQIIYVDVTRFETGTDGFTPRPVAAAAVKVLDVVNRVRLYPPEGEPPREVTVTMREVDATGLQSRSVRTQVYQALAAELGRVSAQLFYTHEPKELGSNLNPR